MAAIGLRNLLAEKRDESGCRARQSAVAAIDEAEFARERRVGDRKKLGFAGANFFLGETFADDRNAQARGDKAFDHANAGEFHRDAQFCAMRAKELVKYLARVARLRDDLRLIGDFAERDGFSCAQSDYWS